MLAEHLTSVKASELETLRHQQFQLKQALAKLEAEVLIYKANAESAEKDKERMKDQNKQLLELLQKEKKQKTMLLIKANENSYNQARDTIEAKRYELLAKSLSEENQSLKNALAKVNQQNSHYSKEKQQLMTKLIILESKAEISQNQQEMIQTLNKSLSTLNSENDMLRQQITLLNKKLGEGGDMIKKASVRDDSKTIDMLVKDFQLKMVRRQQQHSEEKQNYLKKISGLQLQISHLQTQNKQL